MTDKIMYLVQRWEMPLGDKTGMTPLAERVYDSKEKAVEYCRQQDPEGKGFEYTCPCGCQDKHYRSWDVEAVAVFMEN